MKTKLFMLFIAAFAFMSFAKAQNTNTDSAAVASTLKSLLDVCKNVDFGDPKTVGVTNTTTEVRRLTWLRWLNR